MTKKNEVYKCPLCGNIIEVMHTGAGELVCCGQPMDLMAENTVDAAQEKHVPVVEKTDDGYKVMVGSVAHPMQDKHWIDQEKDKQVPETVSFGSDFLHKVFHGASPSGDGSLSIPSQSVRCSICSFVSSGRYIFPCRTCQPPPMALYRLMRLVTIFPCSWAY